MRGGNRNYTDTCYELPATAYVQRDCSSTADRLEESWPSSTFEILHRVNTASDPRYDLDAMGSRQTPTGLRIDSCEIVQKRRHCGGQPAAAAQGSAPTAPRRSTRCCWCDYRSAGHMGPPVRQLTHAECGFSPPQQLPPRPTRPTPGRETDLRRGAAQQVTCRITVMV